MYDSSCLLIAFVVVLSGSKIVDGEPATNTSATNEANRVANPIPIGIPDESQYCWPNVQGATTKASSEWSSDWESKRAIKGLVWSSNWARLTPDGTDDCDGDYGGKLTENCPQWIEIDLAKSTKISHIKFASLDVGSAPTRFKIFGVAMDGWRMLINQDSPDIAEKFKKGRKPSSFQYKIPIYPKFPSKRWFTKIRIEITAIVDSAENKEWGYVTIKNLVLCPW